MDIKKIFNKNVALKLIRAGNDLLNTEPNKKNDRFLVFIFKNTEKLKIDLSNITHQKQI